MLKFFKRMERTRNFVLLFFAILMALSLILFYAPTRGGLNSSLATNEEAVAKVGSEKVTVADLAIQKDNMSRMGRPLPAKFFLDGLISERIVRLEAEKAGLLATDAEVASSIRRQSKPEDGKAFDQEIYERNVTEQFGSVKTYEQILRDDLSRKKLEAFVTSGVTVSEDEILNDYKRKNTKFDLSYVPVNSSDLAQSLKPSDEELKAYFEKNKKNFYISSPQKKISYVFLDSSKIGEKLSISDEELKTEYDKLPDDKKRAGVEGQQIVLRIPKPELESAVLDKANNLVAQAKKDGGKISADAFAEIAKGQSEDAKTAANGGKLSGPVRENPNNPTDPYQRLLTMQPGDVTEPIKYQERYFILRRGEAIPKNFEDAKKEIEVSLRNRRAYGAAAELAQKISDRLKEVKDVQKVAEEFAPQASMNAKDMVRETGFVKPGDDVPNIGVSPQFEEGIGGLVNQGDVGNKIPIQNGFAIPLLVDKRDPRDAEFDEVKAKVAETVKVEQALAKVEEIAKQIAGANSASGLSSAAQAKGLKVQEAKSFILGSPLGQGPSAATSEELENAIYALKQGEITKTPIKINDNWYVVALNSREEADLNDFTKQRDQLIENKLREKRGQVFSDYLASIRREMESKGEIKIYKEALDKIEATPETEEG